MIDTKEIRLFLLRHGYLLIIAAWLFTFAFLFSNYWSYYSSPQGVKRSMEKSIHQREKSFSRIAGDTTITSALLNRSYDQKLLDRISSLEYYLFAYDSSNTGIWLTFWSTSQVQPEELETSFTNGSRFMKLKNGYYEVITQQVAAPKKHHRYLVAVIPVRLEYSIKNNYLVNHFYDKEELGDEYSILREMPSLLLSEHIVLPVNNSKGETLFYLDYNTGMHVHPPNTLSALLMTLGSICVLIFINLFATLLAKTTNPLYGFLFLFIIVLGLRITSYYYPFPFNLRALNVFDPRIYAKDEVFYSLGDLLINVLLTFWMILFFREHVKTINPPVIRNRWIQSLIIIVASLILYIVEQFLAELIQSLVIDSKISFDVTNPFSLTEYSVIGFVVLGFISFSFLFFSQIINYLLNELTNFQYRTKYIWLGAVGVIWLLFRLHNPEIYFFVSMMIWLMLYIVLLDFLADRFESSTATVPFLFWLFLLTITTSAVLVHYNNHKEFTTRQKLAEDLSRKKDPYLEMLLIDVGKKIEHDETIQYFFQDSQRREKRKSAFDNLLLQKYFQGYLSRFRVSIYAYDENGASLFPNADTVSLMTFNRLMFFESQAAPTLSSGNDLYYYERSFNDYSYIVKKEFHNTNNEVSGWLVYTLTPKVMNSGRLYPELLVEGDLSDPTREKVGSYAYAVYDKNILVSNNSGYPFPIRLYAHDLPVSDIAVRTNKGYSEMIYKASQDKVVIVVKENRMFIEFITLFAYMFCLFLLIVAIYKFFDLLIKARMRISNLRSLIDVSIRRKVHGTIIFVVVFSFVILGLTTVKFFTYRSETQNRERLSRTMREVSQDVEKIFANQRDLDQVGDIYDSELMKRLSASLADIAEERALDVNIYDRDGNLQLTTQPMMTDKGLISDKMDPQSFYHLSRLEEVQYIHTEYIGQMPYLSGYTPLRNHDTHEVIAYLNVPYFATQTELNQQISNFLVALINFNAFIFLIAGMLALLITNSITRSFSLVAEKLRHVNLGQRNDEIEWDKDDEIGALVKEYNKMVRKLEVSAVRLAKSEREGAWREMARQVAHEIKNPLTPMKLSIQYLQRAIANDSPNVKELSRNVANTLVEQIEHLSNIASDFSAFARIGEPNNEQIMLNEVLYSLTSLYQGQESCEVEYIAPSRDFYVFADKTQMNRLFTNLLQNAIQAIPEGEHGHIVVRFQETADRHVIVSVSDNGEGISTEIQSRIFVPNFTTKSSGTGLGLAMCKNIAEQARGEIWFETKLNEGTTFYVKLPLI
ncbi:nitrogen fixation/metabolism regulation signal transduction histidine kinase [Chitinophaga terrae (ex Kim and Jung 2007)]|uniref:sensor histidine kinase n=1 Tax=Chitinophaga terrae (ex Kim and Jung 2007) TaxID=408074 RepID=UPI00278294B5|nr:ATP-binding protein [Chitinophaga terrae (ex Kim and Jung 2007)]MDQ0106932.1 nitrogen fixation/metabolism regulation signal transduction histidine kinase [Chitinophaga terrae (ex Kim and Jung 2007)]